MSNNKDYSSIYTMEEFMLNSIAPLYFNMDEINQFNIGLFGYTTHTMADMGVLFGTGRDSGNWPQTKAGAAAAV